tara:strand:+ start:264 stop:482 length:219 start_codon:yes stop_codon:yes gene_type:complete
MTGNEFNQWRSALKLSKVAAARRLGVTPATIRMWEAGERTDAGVTRDVHVPTAIGFACAAIWHRFPAWTNPN